MRSYNPEQYIKLVEKTDNLILQEFMKAELKFLLNSCVNKNIIDLGAGYGRILPYLPKNYSSYTAIEINPKMHSEITKRISYPKSRAILGDITDLRNILKKEKIDLNNSIFTLFQNTLGTIEGDYSKLLNELNIILNTSASDLILSLFKADKLANIGLEIFKSLSSMIGDPDYENTSFTSGEFVSKEGYHAKWWSKAEINMILSKLESKTIQYYEQESFIILHLKGINYE